jgi:hypothetical protein
MMLELGKWLEEKVILLTFSSFLYEKDKPKKRR